MAAAAAQQQAVAGTRDQRWWWRPCSRKAYCGCPAARFVVFGVSGIVVEAGGGVHAADGKLPLPSRRFMIPEVGRSWRY
ncbi:hypothetical protein PF004_g30534 [Phytophthora fragariae]|uniref:Uncharacterized protein n=1 Tax=Phytophthora fragariae TaxID=53985 RepID=A0A6G0MDC8_9STRA|nr:hypothetical protein PF004_g30534 [Phytophthora fragariae]